MTKGRGGLIARVKLFGGCAVAGFLLASCGSDSGGSTGDLAGMGAPTPTPTSAPTPAPSATPTPAPTSSPTPTPAPTPTPMPAPPPSGGSTDPATNTYAVAATQFMMQLHNGFIKVNVTSGSSVKLYSESGSYDSTKPGGIAKDAPAAFLWSEANMIRALYWGARVDPDRFKPLLAATIPQSDWYRLACPNAYGFSAEGACLFDDNSILGGALMDAYLDVLGDDTSYQHARTAIDYLYTNRDEHGGVPQAPADKGKGAYYMAPVVRMAQAYVDYATRNPTVTTTVGTSADAWKLGEDYFAQINDPALGLLLPGGLFRGQTTYVGPGNVWQPANVGPLGGAQANVAALALALYRHSHDPAKLQYAQNLTAAAVAKYVASNGGVSQFASNGGYAMVDMLCDMYMTDHDEKWYNSAKSIVDFLLQNGRDTQGYFADGAPNNDGSAANSAQWNDVRTGMPPDPSIKLLPQSAAAAALLEFAYIDLHRGG